MSDTSSYDATSYDTTSYDTTSYDTSADTSSYETTSFDVSVTTPTYDTGSYDTGYAEEIVDASGYDTSSMTIEETGSTSYDSTDWSAVATTSEGYMADYNAGSDFSNDLYQASVDAYLGGDDLASYELNQASLSAASAADVSWDAAGDVWSSGAETTTVTSYEVTDTSWSAAPADTSWSATDTTDDGSW